MVLPQCQPLWFTAQQYYVGFLGSAGETGEGHIYDTGRWGMPPYPLPGLFIYCVTMINTLAIVTILRNNHKGEHMCFAVIT